MVCLLCRLAILAFLLDLQLVVTLFSFRNRKIICGHAFLNELLFNLNYKMENPFNCRTKREWVELAAKVG
jgi:hypothetical protein